MRLNIFGYGWGEYGNYGGPDYTSGKWYYDEGTKKYVHQEGTEPKDGLDTVYKQHDKDYSYTDIRLKDGVITQEQAYLERVEADAKLIRDSLAYNPFLDDRCDNKAYAEAYKTAAIVAFAEKLIAYDMAAAPVVDVISDIMKQLTATAGMNLIRNFITFNNAFSFESIQNSYHTAEDTRSPIILDLDGDGIETTSLSDGTYFDHDANGFAEQTAWVKK